MIGSEVITIQACGWQMDEIAKGLSYHGNGLLPTGLLLLVWFKIVFLVWETKKRICFANQSWDLKGFINLYVISHP